MALYMRQRFDAWDGGFPQDDSGNGRNGTAVNMVPADVVPGKLNDCFEFAATKYVNFGNIFDLERTQPFSYAGWFQTSSAGTMYLVSSALTSTTRVKGIIFDGGKIYFRLQNTYNSNEIRVSTTAAYHDGAWHHLAITYHGSSDANGVTIYVDGSPVSVTLDKNNLTATIITGTYFQVAGHLGTQYSWVGKIDEFHLFNHELSQAEVTALLGDVYAKINIKGNGVYVPSGDTTPSLLDGTDFGSVTVGGLSDEVFTVENLGGAELNLTGTPAVVLSGMHPGDFSVAAQPSTPVAAYGSEAFTLRFEPTLAGVRSAVVSIGNDDIDENPYTFSIWGAGSPPPATPNSPDIMAVTDNNDGITGSATVADVDNACKVYTRRWDVDLEPTDWVLQGQLGADGDQALTGLTTGQWEVMAQNVGSGGELSIIDTAPLYITDSSVAVLDQAMEAVATELNTMALEDEASNVIAAAVELPPIFEEVATATIKVFPETDTPTPDHSKLNTVVYRIAVAICQRTTTDAQQGNILYNRQRIQDRFVGNRLPGLPLLYCQGGTSPMTVNLERLLEDKSWVSAVILEFTALRARG